MPYQVFSYFSDVRLNGAKITKKQKQFIFYQTKLQCILKCLVPDHPNIRPVNCSIIVGSFLSYGHVNPDHFQVGNAILYLSSAHKKRIIYRVFFCNSERGVLPSNHSHINKRLEMRNFYVFTITSAC